VRNVAGLSYTTSSAFIFPSRGCSWASHSALAALADPNPLVHLKAAMLCRSKVALTTAQGTHTGGPFFDVAPTGKRVRWTSIVISRIADGKIVEERTLWDRLGAFQQLGVVPDQDALMRAMRSGGRDDL